MGCATKRVGVKILVDVVTGIIVRALDAVLDCGIGNEDGVYEL